MRPRDRRSGNVQSTLRACVTALLVFGAQEGLLAQESTSVTDDGRIGAIFAHPIIGDFSGAPYVWFDYQAGGVKSYRVSFPSVIYHAKSWLEGWTGFIVTWKNDTPSGDTRELRPYVGAKVYLPNSADIHLYDLSRYEWRRTTNTDTNTVEWAHRFRTRPGVEFPLNERAWKAGTFYGLANAEVFVEDDFVDALRFAAGVGYIKTDRLRFELQYVAELSRQSPSDALAYDENSFRLDIKFSFQQGLLHRQEGPD